MVDVWRRGGIFAGRMRFPGFRGTFRNEANLRCKWLSRQGRWPVGNRDSLEVLEGFESAEEHAVGGIDAALEAGERVESILIGVAERGIVLDGGVDKIGVSEVFVQALYLIIPELGFDAAEAALNPLGGDEGVDAGEFGGAARLIVVGECGGEG